MFKSNSSLLVLSALVVAQGAYAAAPKSMTTRVQETATSTASTVYTKGTTLAQDATVQKTAAGVCLGTLALRAVDKGADKAASVITSAASSVWSYVPAMPAANDEGYFAIAKALAVENPGKASLCAVAAVASVYGIYNAGKGVYNFVFPTTPAKK